MPTVEQIKDDELRRLRKELSEATEYLSIITRMINRGDLRMPRSPENDQLRADIPAFLQRQIKS